MKSSEESCEKSRASRTLLWRKGTTIQAGDELVVIRRYARVKEMEELSVRVSLLSGLES
jgi:hypothetical protein